MLKIGLGALTLLVLPVAASAQASLPIPVAYFSPQRAFAASPEGKDVETKLAALQAVREKELAARNQKLKALQDALQTTALVLSPTVRQEREREIDRFQVDIQRFVQDAQAEFLGVRRQSESAFVVRLQPALAAVAKEKGLLLVLNEDDGLIAWADPVADITSEVVRRLEPRAQQR
jgi:Skp family chaperone for outer membrane proteins